MRCPSVLKLSVVVGIIFALTLVVGCQGGPAEEDAGQTCGNGVIDDDETCDGTELQGATCAGEGFVNGDIACAEDCTLDRRGCSTCGDQQKSGDEACDGDDFGTTSCGSLGLGEGTLTCRSGCFEVDTFFCRPLCDENTLCPLDTLCVEGACRNLCELRIECGADEHCGANNYCAPGCGTNFDCADTEDCIGGTCTPFEPECAGPDACTCPDGQICRRYRCASSSPCQSNDDCACLGFNAPSCNGFTAQCFDAAP